MAVDRSTLLAQVARVAPSLHKAGTFSTRTLEAIVRHAPEGIPHSAETGSGPSTLLLSHLSGDHTVFAMDAGTNSIRAIESSPLLRRETVTFIEGPTQLTLPRHEFAHSLQLALIDGPHGYPFPDLEYFYLYPRLDEGALLIVDDIHIPTITNLFDFLRADAMFALDDVVETTAFFRRTAAPTFSPTGDGWWEQRYNARPFERTELEPMRGDEPTRTDIPAPWHLDQLGALTDPLGLARIAVPAGDELAVVGWALDPERPQPAAAIDLVLDGVTYRAAIRVPRAVVATAHGDPAYLRCGFNGRFPRRSADLGSHVLEIRIVTAGERVYWPAAQLRFDVV
jgi:hypothetical protein